MFLCKFKVIEVAKIETNCRRLTLQATSSTVGDNKDWSKYTPSGSFSMLVTNEAAFAKIDALNPGDLFWIDLTPVV